MKNTLNTIARTLLVLTIALNAGAVFGNTGAQQSTDSDEVKKELNLGAKAYVEGDFKQAQEHFKLARTLDPNNKHAALFYAQAINAQRDPETTLTVMPMPPRPPRVSGQKETPADQDYKTNVDLAKRAIVAFQDALSLDPQNDTIYVFIAHIYQQIGDTDQQQKWLIKRANLDNLDPGKKCDIYYSLAAFKWQQTYPITARWTDTATGPHRADNPMYHIYMRSDFPAAERAKAEFLTSEGLDYINKVLAIDPDYANAYSYLALLHREQAKLANNLADKKKYLEDYTAAIAKFTKLTDKQKP